MESMAKSALLFLVQNHNPRTHIWAGLLLERKLTLWHLLLCWTPDTGKKKSADGSMSRASRPEDRVTLRTRRSRHAAQFFLPSSLAFSCYFLHFLFLSINLTRLTSLLPLKSYVYRLPPPLPLPEIAQGRDGLSLAGEGDSGARGQLALSGEPGRSLKGRSWGEQRSWTDG